MMRRLLLLILLLAPLGAYAQTVSFANITVNPSSTPADADKMIDETGTNSYTLTYLNHAKYVVGKVTGDCTISSSFAITCTKINGLTFPSLVANDCLAANAGATALVFTTCGSGGGSGTFDGIGTGTNTTATMTVGSGASLGHSGTGQVDANYTNGLQIASNMATAGNAGVMSTNASAQLTTQNWLALPALTYAALTAALTCNSTNQGVVAMVKDSNAAPGSNITAGSSTNKVLALCDGTNWVAH